MGVNECTAHGVFASKRCAVCLKPMCNSCVVRDGCCSEKCFKSRQKFGFVGGGPVRRTEPLLPWGTLIKLAVLAGAAYFAAKHFGYL
jgi:hypothetical protein